MTTNDYGRPGEHSSEAMLDFWRTAARLNQEFPGRGEWVPWRSIEVRHDILPRAHLDDGAVERYAEAFNELPPITVQRNSFVLLDGLHRLTAAPKAVRDHIRIEELDVKDAQLEDEAVRLNTTHGVLLTLAERMAAGRKMFERHHPDTGGTSGEAWTDARIAAWSGVSRRTVIEWLSKDRQRVAEPAPEPEQLGLVEQFARQGPLEQPITRLATNGRRVAVGRLAPVKPLPPPTRRDVVACTIAWAAARATLTEKLRALEVTALVRTLNPADQKQARAFIRECRAWLDGFEQALDSEDV